MTTRTIEVGGLFSSPGARGIERQIKRITSVDEVSVNPVSGSTTVTYDAGKTSLGAIRATVEACGFHCAREALPKHLCADKALPRARPATRRAPDPAPQEQPDKAKAIAARAAHQPDAVAETAPVGNAKPNHDGPHEKHAGTPLMRDNCLSNRIYAAYDDIVAHCCDAWNALTQQPWRITSIGMHNWAHRY